MANTRSPEMSAKQRTNLLLEEDTNAVYQLALREVDSLEFEIITLRALHLHNKDTHEALAGIAEISNDWQVKPHELYPDAFTFSRTDHATQRKYEVSVDFRNDITTFTFNGDPNGKDRKNSIVGTDNTAVVKLMHQDSYDYVKIDDFIDRQKSIFDTVRRMLGNEPEALKILDLYESKILTKILNECDFYDPVHSVRNEGTLFEEKHERFMKISRQSLTDVCYLINTTKPEINESIENISEAIRKQEIEMLNERGRPFVIKSKEIEGKTFLSMQQPLGEKTLVSADRSGKDPDVKLSNHVREGTAVVNDQREIKLLYSVDGHSSYPAIDAKDETYRQNVAVSAAKEKARQIIYDQFRGRESELQHKIDNKITIPIEFATMMMLSAVKLGLAEKAFRKKDSENAQLVDTRTGLQALGKTTELEIPGMGTARISVINHCMNQPVNLGKTQNIVRAPEQVEMNNKGMLEYLKQINQFYQTNKVEFRAEFAYTTIFRKIESFLHEHRGAESIGLIDTKQLKKELNLSLIHQKINYLCTHIDEHRSDLSDGQWKILVQQIMILKSVDSYFNNEFMKSGNKYQFQTNYLLSMEEMGKLIEAFCKSAEDRTYFLRTCLLTETVFKEVYGRPTKVDDPEDKHRYLELLKTCLEFGAGIENTKYNSNARGAQIRELETIGETGVFNIAAGDHHAKSAKAVYKDLPPNPSKELVSSINAAQAAVINLRSEFKALMAQGSKPGTEQIQLFIPIIRDSKDDMMTKLQVIGQLRKSVKPDSALDQELKNMAANYARQSSDSSSMMAKVMTASPPRTPTVSPPARVRSDASLPLPLPTADVTDAPVVKPKVKATDGSTPPDPDNRRITKISGK